LAAEIVRFLLSHHQLVLKHGKACGVVWPMPAAAVESTTCRPNVVVLPSVLNLGQLSFLAI